MAPDLELFCGTKSIDRSAFSSAMYATWLAGGADGNIISRKAFDAGWNRRRMLMYYENLGEIPLIAALSYAGQSQATDDKDRIYSLLSLVSRDDRMLIRTPDYSNTTTVADVFTKLVKSFVADKKSLDVICFAHDHKRTETNPGRSLDLPSWVPDWTIEVETKVVPLMASQAMGEIGNFRPLKYLVSTAGYAASGNREAAVLFPDDKIMSCQGLVIDHIDGLGGGMSEPCIPSTSPSNTSSFNEDRAQFGEFTTILHTNSDSSSRPRSSSPSNLLGCIARSLVLDRTDMYLNHAVDTAKISVELQGFGRAALTRPGEVHPSFLHWFDETQALRLRGWTLEELFRSLPLPPSAQRVDVGGATNRESLGKRIKDTIVVLQRRLMVTECGHIGMAPNRARQGDVVCVLLGCSIPVVLRKREANHSYEFIGECYVHGFMKGEIIEELDAGHRQLQTFDLT